MTTYKLTKRGKRVVGIACIALFLGAFFIAGRFDAMDACAKMQAHGDWQSAIDAGCSFDALPNGEYPFTWQP
jgi:hypothetical protein